MMMLGVDNGQKGGTDMIHKKKLFFKNKKFCGSLACPKKGVGNIYV
jgi:hypothetical protein